MENSDLASNRRLAMERGDDYYFTGKPCKNGGVAPRRVKNYQCTCDECVRIDRERSLIYARENSERVAAYKSRWHQENKERLRKQSREYYLENREYFLEKAREYREANPGKVSECKKRWYENNFEYASEKSRNRYYSIRDTAEYQESRRQYYLKNRDRILANTKAYAHANREYIRGVAANWREENRERVREYQSRRRATKRNALPSWYGELDEFVIQEAYDLLPLRRDATGMEWHVDHMIPLQASVACGLHCAPNIQVIPEQANLSKRNNMTYTERMEWLEAVGGDT